jgi:replicative DNA helicase
MTALDEQTFDRMPPHDLEAEVCALGAAMLSTNAALTVVEDLIPDDFFRPGHRTIFTAIDRLVSSSEPVNPVSVRAEMERLRDGNVNLPDGLYLHSLIEKVPVGYSASFFVKRLRGFRLLRGLASAGLDITNLGYGTAAEDVDHALEMANKFLDEATRTATKGTAAPVADLITPFLESLESGEDLRGVTTGWADVDDLFSRLRPGQLITVGARPGMGKTSAILNVAHHVGITLGLPAWIGTLEMSTDECMARLVAKDARIELRKILRKELTDQDWERLRRSHDRLLGAGTLIIDDEPGMGVGHVRAALRSMRRAGTPAAFAGVDYIQLLTSKGRVENRQVEVSGFARTLKLLAKEYEVPIMVGAQLNREVEHRAEKRPTMADLRESGSIEQDSDIVILLYRDDAYDPESPHAGEIDFIVDKNRSGPKATIKLAFQGHYAQIVDLAKPQWSPTGALS